MNELTFASVRKVNTIKKSIRKTLVKWTTSDWYAQGKYDKKEYTKDAGEMNHKWLVWS